MSTYDDLAVGDTFVSPSLTVSSEDAAALVRIGGYTHPLFTDPDHAASSPFGRSPLPGEAVLHAMGGMVEQTGRFDETVIALTGFEEVRFLAPAFPSDALTTEVEVLAKEDDEHKPRGTLVMRWTCSNAEGTAVCNARARMLFRRVVS